MKPENKIETSNARIRAVTNLGIAVNIILAVIKVAVGFLAGSIALITDGIHSISDMATDFAVLFGIHYGSKQPDSKHPYGHGRVETFSAAFISLVLIIVGAGMIFYAGSDIAKGHVASPNIAVLIVAVISIVSKEFIYKITKSVAIKSHSPVLYANAWHHRSDALSSIAVAIGFISLKFGFEYGDQIAAVAVGIMIILVGARVISDCLNEIFERAVDSDTIEQIKQIIASKQQIRQWHRLRTRTVGREIFLDLHILVDPDLTITDAHEIAEALETALHEQITRPVNITVHIEPDKPELRK